MTQEIEARLRLQLPAAADAILAGAVDPPDVRQRRRRTGVLAVAAAVLVTLGVGAYAVRSRQQPVVIATSAESAAASSRTAGLDSGLYVMANDVMAPTIPAMGQVELFDRGVDTALERGDLVLVAPETSEGVPAVRRIVGLPGEGVVVQGLSVLVNGARLYEPYVAVSDAGGPSTDFDTVLGPNEFLLLPDNRNYDEVAVVEAASIARWAPRQTTALKPYDASDRPGALEDYDECLRTAGVDTLDIATDPASIFDDTARRLTPTNMDRGAECMRQYLRLGIELDPG